MAGREQAAAGSGVARLCPYWGRVGPLEPEPFPGALDSGLGLSAGSVQGCGGGGEPGGLPPLLPVGILAESVQLGACWGPTLPAATC